MLAGHEDELWVLPTDAVGQRFVQETATWGTPLHKVSRNLSWLLRRGMEQEGIGYDAAGWASVDVVRSWMPHAPT